MLKAWEGLGYYSRARSLHAAARIVANELGGQFPQSVEGLLKLPGIGAYTAGAVASIAFGERAPAIDGNVTRVAARFFGVYEDVGERETQRRIRELVSGAIPPDRPGDFNQALMELGATLCVPGEPRCELCPLNSSCAAAKEGDAAILPVHEKKRPPKRVDMAVCLVEWDKKVLVTRREQRMLGGMYVFVLLEDEKDARHARERLMELGLDCGEAVSLGNAKHVFTHRVWDMQVFSFQLKKAPDQEALDRLQARFVDADGLRGLPMPAAVRVAREIALRRLEG